MIVKPAGIIPIHAYLPARGERASQPGAATVSAPVDTVSLSDAARAMQNREWEGAQAMQRSGVPQLINVESAIAGGMSKVEDRLGQWLAGRGFDADTRFSLGYDAASRSFRVEGSPEVKAVLEAELNSATPSAAALREGYALLEDLSSGLAAARKQFALDQAAGGHDVASRREGFAYRFNLDWADQSLAARLEALSGNVSIR